jgi:DNA repair exonuclease SbcCD ATPase subunit
METTKIFDSLDRKIEKLLGRLAELEEENDRLKTDLTSARRAEKDAADSRGTVERLKADLATARRAEKDASESKGIVERLERDQETVRVRLEKLIGTLEAAERKASPEAGSRVNR